MITAFPSHSEWMDQGACLDHDPDMFYSQGSEREIPPSRKDLDAIAVCETCPVIAECLEAALKNGERWGIWGGKTPTQRAADHEPIGRPIYVIKHGTGNGYHGHRRHDVPMCQACRIAHNKSNRERKARREIQSKDAV